MAAFAQSTSVVDSLHAILRQYPHGSGTLRELVQNSDDAGAATQVFVLDRRTHPAGEGFDNGPAFLAYNDALVTDADWEGLQKISGSPKRTELGKTGKYGLGFRSCFHITDTPEILSGRYIATFDPLQRLLGTKGVKHDYIADGVAQHKRHLDTFSAAFDPAHDIASPLNATVIRLPLRTDVYSALVPGKVSANSIRELLDDFVRNELSAILLFLRHLSSIVVKEVDANGIVSVLATARIDRTRPEAEHGTETRELTIEVVAADKVRRTTRWLAVSHVEDPEPYISSVSARVGSDVSALVAREKLSPDVALAVPIQGGEHVKRYLGRLYTFLPLPIYTGFPCVVNASFALTPDRQALLNPETDVAPDSSHRVFVAWNRVLFSAVLPVVWAALLRVSADRAMDVYALWPQAHGNIAHGQAAYWHSVPSKLAREVCARAQPVWKHVSVAGQLVYGALSADTLVVQEEETEAHVAALALLGVPICRISLDICQVLAACATPSCEITLLSPASAHTALLKRKDAFGKLSNAVNGGEPNLRLIILQYLLSAASLANILDLPLITTTAGSFVSIHHQAQIECFVFDDAQLALFAAAAPVHTRASELPPQLLKLLSGSTLTNVRQPGSENIADFVKRKIEHTLPRSFWSRVTAPLSAPHSAELVEWSTRLWTWIKGLPFTQRIAHLNALAHITTVPDPDGSRWHAPANGVYPLSIEVKHVGLRRLLAASGVAFSHPDIPSDPLREGGFLCSIRDAPRLLATLVKQTNVLKTASQSDLNSLCVLLADVLETARLTPQDRRALCTLPIFPVLASGFITQTSSRQTIDIEAKLRVVPNNVAIPRVIGFYFMQEDALSPALFRALSAQHMTAEDVLKLAINSFTGQSRELQAAVVQHLARDVLLLPSTIPSALAHLQFVAVAGGTARAKPGDVLSPISPLCTLLDARSSTHIAHTATQMDRDIIDGLARLNMLGAALTSTIANACIEHVSTTKNVVVAQRLFNELARAVGSGTLDARALRYENTWNWIMCEDGVLRGPTQCRDDDTSGSRKQSRALFDRVLGVAAQRAGADTLRARLGWNECVSLDVLKRQFAVCVRETPLPLGTLQTLAHELAKHELGVEDIAELRKAAGKRAWIAVDDRDGGGELEGVPARFAVFSLDGGSMPPFRKIRATEHYLREFFQQMGCAARPTNVALIGVLQDLFGDSGSTKTPQYVCSLLEALQLDGLDRQAISELLVPSDSGALYPCSQVLYNDVGTRAYLVQLPDDMHRAHGYLRPELARKLGIKELSTLHIEEEEEEEDMGELLSTRISNVLRQYSPEQMPTEFLANAIDAGASSVSFTIDTVDFSGAALRHGLLTADLGALQADGGGALVVHNDAVFQQKDWRGIRRIGQGSKRGETGNIGRFGLGALATYHFSEVLMIVSGQYFLLLDPSKRYLRTRASRLVKLRDMHSLFPNQLAPFYGLHGFDADTENYNGTIFRLPLRTLAEARASDLSTNYMDTSTVEHLLDAFESRAKLAALFNPRLGCLKMTKRSMDRHTNHAEVFSVWQLDVHRLAVHLDDPAGLEADHAEVRVISSRLNGNTESWRTGSRSLSKTDVPVIFQDIFAKYLLPDTISVGVAVPSRYRQSAPPHSLFSHLPLPINTSLPFHVHASFILAEDRRNIRFDEADDQSTGGSESAFNRHLLSVVLPHVYLSVLHHWPHTGEARDSLSNGRFWPSSGTDGPSRLVGQSIFKLVGTDSRAICESVTGVRIPPSRAVFADLTLHKDVVHILTLLAPPNLVVKPAVLERTSVRRVDAEFAQELAIKSADQLGELYADKQFTVTTLLTLVQYLRGEDRSANRLDGLRLLPLADGTLSHFRHDARRSLDSAVFALDSTIPSWRSLFPPSRFVHPDACGQLLVSLAQSTLQVAAFDEDALAHFANSRLDRCTTDVVLADPDAAWVRALWAVFDRLHPAQDLHENLRALPLVPIAGQGNRHISVVQCGGSNTLLRTLSTPQQVVDALSAMGAIFIDQSQLPVPLRSRDPIRSMTFTFSSVLQFIDRNMLRLGQMNEPQTAILRDWVTQKVRSRGTLPAEDLRIVRALPLFRIRNTQQYVSADQVQMLPRTVRIEDVLPLTRVAERLAPYDDSLAKALGVTPVSFNALEHALARGRPSGPVTDGDHLQSFKRLLGTILSLPQAITEMRTVLQVPDASGVYVRPDTLYSRRVNLFVTAFDVQGRRPDLFLHSSLADHDPGLRVFGMHTEENQHTFEQCALAVQSATDAGKTDSARVVYECYRERLPFVQGISWNRFDAIQFIPRVFERREHIPALGEYAQELPMVVSPNQLVRAEFQSVAWTQRGCFEVEPTARLLAEHANLGVPSIGEVIEHIRVLSGIPSSSQDKSAVAKDARASYRFLQDRAHCLSEVDVVCLQTGAFFLNVDDHNAQWTWCSANELILNATDDGPNYKMVHSSLRPFAKLLRALGTSTVESIEAPEIRLAGAEGELRRLREGFDAKRRAQVGIDVVFIDASDSPGRHPAHKLFLSVCGAFFDDKFYAAGMRESAILSFAPLEVQVEYSGEVVERCLDFLYTGAFANVEHEHLQILLDMLALADYWRLDDLKSTVQRDLVPHLSPRVYEDVRGYAERYNAEVLLASCREWERRNQAVLQRGVDRSSE